MIKGVKKLIAGILIGTFVVSIALPGAAFAGETKEADSSELPLEYIYVESPYLETPAEQNVVVSWGDGTEQIEKRELRYQHDGEEREFELENKGEGLYLFQKTFDESESGVYEITDIRVTEEGQESTYCLAEAGINACFGVNEYYPGYEPVAEEKAVDLGGGVAVVTEEAVEDSKVEEIVEETITFAAMEAGFTAEVSTYALNDEARSSNGQVVVALDAGHCDLHAGASGNGVKEEEATLKIAQYCKAELEQYAGVKVYMCRTSAACPYPEVNVEIAESYRRPLEDIRRRVRASVAQGADIYVSIHLNSIDPQYSSANGAEVWYPDGSQTPDTVGPGRELAQKIQSELVSLGLYNRGAKETDDNFACMDEGGKYGLPAIIVEHAFLSNANDASKYLKTEDGLKSLGVADATGIAKYFGLSKGKWVQENGKWKYQLPDGSFVAGSWRMIDGKWYYFGSDAYMCTGWLTLNDSKFYLSPSGAAVTGWQTIEGKKYYFDSGCYMVTGWQTIDGVKYYFDETTGELAGTHAPGWNQVNGDWYYIKSDGSSAIGWEYIGGNYYYFAADGKMQTGWQYIGGQTYYFHSAGRMLTGWQTIEGATYYFHSAGRMLTGWQTIEGKEYYFEKSGAMVTGIVTIDGKRYRFGSDGVYLGEVKPEGWNKEGESWYYIKSDGSNAVGWEVIGGYYYYFAADGKMLTGWQYLGGQTYYFHSAGRMLTGWQTIDGATYYFHSAGRMLTGWQTIEEEKYYFEKSGAMVTGIVTIDGKKYQFGSDGVYLGEVTLKGWNKEGESWYYIKSDGSNAVGWEVIGDYYYYFAADGKMMTGWQYIGGQTYYFHSAGRMLTGWQTINGATYYFHSAGRMLTGWQMIEEKKYYFEKSGAMVTGIVTIDGKKYQFGSDGVCLGEELGTGWNKVGDCWYYVKADGEKAVGWEYIGGYYYYFAADGKMLTGWQYIGGQTYYFHSAGRMLTGWQFIDNVWYYFHSAGRMLTGWQMIGGTWCYFEKNGVYKQSGVTSIEGKSQKTKSQMIAFYQDSGFIYPAKALGNGGAESLEKFVDIYIEEAEMEGIRADVAFVQAMLETKYLQFGGDVKIEQFNFAGLGATGGGVPGNAFPDVRTGVRAQIQHLKAYATSKSLNQECVDTRYQYVNKGSAPYVEWLGIQENPNKCGWAAGKDYGFHIVAMLNKM